MNDAIHGCFGIAATLFTLLNVLALYHDKEVRGISMSFMVFLLVLSAWNIHYLDTLGQDLAVAGAVGLFITNMIWFTQMVYYLIKESKSCS